jgi:hypothetical protein
MGRRTRGRGERRWRAPCAALLTHRCSGKGLGGSSAINFLVWCKPPAADIDGKCLFHFSLLLPC